MRIFRYFYYRLYRYYEGERAPTLFSVFVSIAVLFILNILALLIITTPLFNATFELPVVNSGLGCLWPWLFLGPLYGLFYYFLRIKGRHERIIHEFENETHRAKLITGILVVFYFFASLASFIILVISN